MRAVAHLTACLARLAEAEREGTSLMPFTMPPPDRGAARGTDAAAEALAVALTIPMVIAVTAVVPALLISPFLFPGRPAVHPAAAA